MRALSKALSLVSTAIYIFFEIGQKMTKLRATTCMPACAHGQQTFDKITLSDYLLLKRINFKKFDTVYYIRLPCFPCSKQIINIVPNVSGVMLVP